MAEFGGFDDVDRGAGVPASQDVPVFPPLATQMGISLILNPESKVWLVHERPFPDILMWTEYDIDRSSLTLVFRGGKVQDIGMAIQPPMRKYLARSRQIYTMLLQGDKVADCYIMPLLVRDIKGFNAQGKGV